MAAEQVSVLSPEVNQTCSFRGSKSRNKVSVGEPAEGSLTHPFITNTYNGALEPAKAKTFLAMV
jgi:hypothetical protein